MNQQTDEHEYNRGCNSGYVDGVRKARQELVEEIEKLGSENWQDTYEAGLEDAKEMIINLLQDKYLSTMTNKDFYVY